MATTFLDPGGDATFNVATKANGGLWNGVASNASIASDFVHGNHLRSIKITSISSNVGVSVNSVVADSGTRISFYLYINALPTGNVILMDTFFVSANHGIILKSSGVIGLAAAATQFGEDGPTLVTGQWYRISLAYKITSGSINRFNLFVDGVPKVSVVNKAGLQTNSDILRFGVGTTITNAVGDFRISDIYVDNSSFLTDTGDVWVTAKRPNANGTTNGFTTQIGVGGSGYGTGHSPQVNERALSTSNGWSMVGVGAAVVEEYNIESISTGDLDLTGKTIIDYMGWVYTSSLASETINIILGGVNFSQAITSTNTLYTKVAGSSTYPDGTGADIGIQTDTSLTTVSLFECGVLVAYRPPEIGYLKTNRLRPRIFAPGSGR